MDGWMMNELRNKNGMKEGRKEKSKAERKEGGENTFQDPDGPIGLSALNRGQRFSFLKVQDPPSVAPPLCSP